MRINGAQHLRTTRLPLDYSAGTPPLPRPTPSATANTAANRIAALQRFAGAITLLNILGHLFFGFEQSWAQLVTAIVTAYAMELLLEGIDAWSARRPTLFRGGCMRLLEFLLPAHITGMAISMLLFAGDRLLPFAFAAAVGIASKALFQASVGGRSRHFLNPSNTGIAVTLILFSSVGIAPPYQFTETTGPVGDALLPAIIVLSGTFLNARFTGRIPLIVGWVGGFAIQAVLRAVLEGTPIAAGLNPMIGMAFTLFTFYMISDPGTTPSEGKGQFLFGMSIAAAYAALMEMHIVFGLFFALFAVCILRGIGLHLLACRSDRRGNPHPWSRLLPKGQKTSEPPIPGIGPGGRC